MRFYPTEKMALVVDGPNLWHAAKDLGFDIDYGKLRAVFAHKGVLSSACYFTRMDDATEFSPVRPLVDWLAYNGWSVTTRGKDTDVDLAVAVMELSDDIDHLVLVTGDSDFVSLVEALKRRAVRVTVLSTIKAPGANCSDDLRRAADEFMELKDLREAVSRPDRNPKEAA